MVTQWSLYQRARESMLSHGFVEDDCEYLILDNSSGNQADAFVAANEFLQAACGDYVILCHQDIFLLADGRAELEERLEELDSRDPTWAVVGNAGFNKAGWPVFCISDQFQEVNVTGGPFPARVQTLDENFLVVRRSANLAVSRDLAGFHHYAPDLCLVAELLGWSCYVIDFFLRHESSAGPLDDRYRESGHNFSAKYTSAFAPRRLHLATGAHVDISGVPTLGRAMRWLLKLNKLIGRSPRNRDLWSPGRQSTDPKYAHAFALREATLRTPLTQDEAQVEPNR